MYVGRVDIDWLVVDGMSEPAYEFEFGMRSWNVSGKGGGRLRLNWRGTREARYSEDDDVGKPTAIFLIEE